MKKPIILCVDDEKIILDSLEEQIINRLGKEFDCELAEGGEEALEIIQDILADKNDVAVVISDQLMPGMTGDEFLIKAHALIPNTPKILLTGQAGLDAVKNAINKARLYRYVNKPWEENDLLLTIEEAARAYQRHLQMQEYNRLLRTLNKAAQEISGEIDYRQLVNKLMTNVVLTIGAEVGYLLTSNENKLKLEAAYATAHKEFEYINTQMNNHFSQFNQSIIQKLTELIEEDSQEHCFVAPITKKGKNFGFILLENKNTKVAFNSYQKEVIQMLAAQAAISLDNANLYNRIEERNKQLEESKKIIEEKNKDILDSIRYARRIQEAIMPEKELLNHYFPESFIFYQPKDIVSGDFYWFMEKYHKFFIAAVDCTGHGVPGAFMSVIGSNLLNQILNEYSILEPEAILDHLNFRVQTALKQDQNAETKDGMDIAFCSIDQENDLLQYAGANRPLWLIRNGELIKYDPDRIPIGGGQFGTYSYTGHNIILQPDDIIYIFTDGIVDQFGGEQNKKFTSKRFAELLLEISHEPMSSQMEIIQKNFHQWKGKEEQTDDVLIIGIKYSSASSS